MKVEDLKALIQHLPDDMEIIMPMGEGVFLHVCNGQSRVMGVQYPDIPIEKMLVLFPCTCHSEELRVGIQPLNLN